MNLYDLNGLWSVKVSAFKGKGFSVTFGRSKGKWFVMGGAGVGLGGGIKFYPEGEFPAPSDGSSFCGTEAYIGFNGSFGVSSGPMSAEIKGHTGGIMGNGADGKPEFKFTESGGFDYGVRGQAGWGIGIGGGVTVGGGLAW